MNLDGEQIVPAGRKEVWNALYSPDVLQRCIPGCETVRGSPGEGEVEVVATQKVGPVKARFKVIIALSDIRPYESVTLNGQGSGGVAGFARGAARVKLSDLDAKTLVQYDAEFAVGGKLAQIGSRIVRGVARKFIDRCFENLRRDFEGG